MAAEDRLAESCRRRKNRRRGEVGRACAKAVNLATVPGCDGWNVAVPNAAGLPAGFLGMAGPQ